MTEPKYEKVDLRFSENRARRPGPNVTVVTPVYDGEEFLADCIESVLAQTYTDFDYLIVNNCSTDASLEIAKSYEHRDSRVRVHNNDAFLGCIENHNFAFSLIPLESDFCKVVSADDWLYPQCLEKLLSVAHRYPTTGIIGSYQLRGNDVMWTGIPTDIECLSGREACRMSLIQDMSIFGPPTSSLYRSQTVRSRKEFFPTTLPYGDTSACFASLKDWDYGFVHEVLSVERIHEGRVSTRAEALYTDAVAAVDSVVSYGPTYLDETELSALFTRTLRDYYRRLGGSVLKLKGREFWKFHSSTMKELGYPISWRKVAWAAVAEIFHESTHPTQAFKKLISHLRIRGR